MSPRIRVTPWFVPMYGAPYIRDLDGVRRYGSLEDLNNFHKLAYMAPALHSSSSIIWMGSMPGALFQERWRCASIMPGMSGLQVIEAIRARHPRARGLLVSGYTNDEMTRRGIEAADVEFLSKPFVPSELLRRIRSILQG